MSAEVNVLIGSGGRRNYLVNWFREAMADLELQGNVCVVDSAPSAPALADADRAATVPPFASDEYLPALDELCGKWNVSLAFSLNDFEATLWASAGNTIFRKQGINVIAATKSCQELVEDKAAYETTFSASGILTPRTMLGSEALDCADLPWDGDVIVKHRYGSGSVGLARVSQRQWRDQLLMTAESAKDRSGRAVRDAPSGLANVVVQQAIDGVEHGVDVVHDFDGTYVGVLVRRKLRMRSGETDQAITVAQKSFDEIARGIGRVTGHRGLIDTDVLVTDSGEQYVIDVNPRFGGGYPFSHVAGASIPHAYLAWQVGLPLRDEWLAYDTGVTSAKTEDIRVARPELLDGRVE